MIEIDTERRQTESVRDRKRDGAKQRQTERDGAKQRQDRERR